ncbi:hypothetical protein JW824_01280 [bacterium]|nr:hypothetical protein [bacterium]RQV98536.1 MAG: hypothetical protein EH221_01670 [bacterium]
MVKRLIIVLGIVFLLLFVAGCYQVKMLVKLNPDGSGTIEEEFLMSTGTLKEMGGMMEQMMGGMMDEEAVESEESESDDPYGMFDEAKLKEEAAQMGEGVTYVSGSRVQSGGFDGYRAVYAFTDVNKLKVDQNPNEKMPSQFSDVSTGGEEEDDEFVTFNFTKGNPAKLVITQPEDRYDEEGDLTSDDSEESSEDDAMGAAMMGMMQDFFRDMRIVMEIEVQGNIVQTNATYREGSKITLMDLDFGKLFDAPGGFEKFSQAQPDNVEDAKQVLKDLPGVKVELNKEVVVQFR